MALGIRDKKLISIISAMLKAEVKGIGIPEKGVPQGGILSPLLSNIVLNELDWWIASQWEEMPPKHNRPFIRKDNGKMDKGTIFLAYRERSNLKRHYSEFLGFQLRLHKKRKTKTGRPKYTVKSHITDKAATRIKTMMHKQIKSIQTPVGNRSGHVSVDFWKIGHSTYKSLTARIKGRIKRTGKRILPYVKGKYGESDQLRYVYDTALAPIGYVKHRQPSMLRVAINPYTPEGRAAIHKRLEGIDTRVLSFLMRNPVQDKSVEYNDNRLSLYCGQGGKCAITGQYLEIGLMHCHHIVPLCKGGTDKYANLLFVSDMVHRLIHATTKKTMEELLSILRLDDKQMRKLNKFRIKAGLPEIA